jgi:hypothetical protein
MTEKVSSVRPISNYSSQRLRNIRNSLLRLHKLLLDHESAAYEQAHGKVSKGELFQLVLNHEWFAWLRSISKLVVQIDEMFAADEPATQDEADALMNKIRLLLRPSENGVGFEKKYYDALQRDPDVILLHAEVSRLLISSV